MMVAMMVVMMVDVTVELHRLQTANFTLLVTQPTSLGMYKADRWVWSSINSHLYCFAPRNALYVQMIYAPRIEKLSCLIQIIIHVQLSCKSHT